MADPEKTIRDSIRHTLDGWPAGPFTHAEDCKGCRITAALDQLVALLAEKDAEIERKDVVLHLCRGHLRELRMDTPEDDALVKKIKNLVDDTLVEAPYPPPTRLDRRTRETLEAAGRAMSDAEEYLRDFRYARGAIATAQVTKLQDARRQIVHLLAEDEGEPPVVLTIREVPRCTGHCVFDGDTLTVEDLCCPIHGHEAQQKAQAAGLGRVGWMQACRASWPLAPTAVREEAASIYGEPVGPNCPFGHPWGVNEEVIRLAAELERAHAVIEAARLHHAACLAEPMDGAAVSYVCVSLWAAIAAFDRQATETTT